MANKTRTRAVTAPTNNQGTEEEVYDREGEVLERVKAELQDGGPDADWQCHVYRLVPRPGRQPIEEWIFDHNVDDLRSIRPTLAGEWGKGMYRARVLNGTKPRGQYEIAIGVDLRPKPLVAQPVAGALAGATPLETMMLTVLDRMDKRDQVMMAVLERITTPAQPADPADQMLKMAQLMKEFREINAPANIGLDMFKEGLGLAKTLADAQGDGRGGGNLYDIALAAIEKFPAVLEQARAAQQQQQPKQIAARPAPATLPVRPAAPASPPRSDVPAAVVEPGSQTISPAILQLKDFLLVKAKEGAQPDLYVDHAMQSLGDAGLTFLEQQEYPLDFLEKTFPEIVEFHPWFERLVDLIWPDGDDSKAPAPDANSSKPSPDTGRPEGHA